MNKRIAVIRGDGIGPEIVGEAIHVLNRVAEKFGHTFTYDETLMGGCAIDAYGDPFPKVSLDQCLAADAVLLGAVGGPKWDNVPKEIRPERGLLRMRSSLGLYANIRPTKLFPQMRDACPLKPEISDKGVDFVVVRELVSGVYFGEHRSEQVNGQEQATDIMAYTEEEIRRIAHVAFRLAEKRRKKVCSVDKANVLATSRLWRRVVTEVAENYPSVELSHMYVDNCAMQIIRAPHQFDVIVTENLFGDILSDEASIIGGSIGLIPSASMGSGTLGVYEPIHGSAPDIAGTDAANPIGTILAAAEMLRNSFDMLAEAKAVEDAVSCVLDQGYRCGDIMSEGMIKVGCKEMGRRICEAI